MAYPDFVAAGAEVIGVSPDPPERLEQYARDKETPFRFASDAAGTIWPAWSGGKRRMKRVTFVVKRGGTIAARMHHEILIPKHISQALDVVKGLG